MTNQLQRAIERLQQLPIEDQIAIAERILEEIDEREWDKITSKPHVQQAINELAEEAKQQEEAGEIEEGGFAPDNNY
jgi:hypothetical protein